MAVKTIKVGQLARVEGEGALKVTIKDGVVKKAELNIFEPPRFFEAWTAFCDAPLVNGSPSPVRALKGCGRRSLTRFNSKRRSSIFVSTRAMQCPMAAR